MRAGHETSSSAAPTPIVISPRTRWLILAVVVGVAVVVLGVAPPALTMLVGGLTLAMFCSLPVRLLSRFMRRGVAIALMLAGLVVVGAATVLFVVPVLIDQLQSLIAAAPQTQADVEEALADLLRPLERWGIIDQGPDTATASLTKGTFSAAINLAGWFLAQLLTLLSNLAAVGFVLFGMALVAIYVLIDIDRYRGVFVDVFPRRYRADATQLWSDLGQAISRYLGGLAIAMADQGILVALMLWLLGVPYAALFGLWMAVTSILPYVGAWLAAVPAVVVAFAQQGLITAAIIGLGYVAINFWDSNIVQPAVLGRQLRVSPLLVFLGVVVGSQVGGLLGTVVALPVLAMSRVFLDFFRDRLRVDESKSMPARPGDEAVAFVPTAPAPAGEPATRSTQPSSDATTRAEGQP